LIGDLGGRNIPKARKVSKKKQRRSLGFWDILGMSFLVVMITLTLAMTFAFAEAPWRTVGWTLVMLGIVTVIVLMVRILKRSERPRD
jgi:hypothetical protein